MHTKKFVKLSNVDRLRNSELKNVKGGKDIIIIPPPKPKPLYGIHPLYGIEI